MGPNALFPLGCVPEPSFVAKGYVLEPVPYLAKK